MPKLTGITVRAASRQPIGAHGFQEASVALSFAVTEDDPVLDGLADHVSAELEAAFERLWRRIEGVPNRDDGFASPRRNDTLVRPDGVPANGMRGGRH